MTARTLRAKQHSAAKRYVQPPHRSITAKELRPHTALSFCGCRVVLERNSRSGETSYKSRKPAAKTKLRCVLGSGFDHSMCPPQRRSATGSTLCSAPHPTKLLAILPGKYRERLGGAPL